MAIACLLLGGAARGAVSFGQSPIGEAIAAAAQERDPRDPTKGNRRLSNAVGAPLTPVL